VKTEETQLGLQTSLDTRIRILQEEIPDIKKDLHEYLDFRARGTLVNVKVKVKVTLRLAKDRVTFRLTVSQSVLVSSPHLVLMMRYLLLFDNYSLVIVERPPHP
jgi:hypothetical protein